MTLFERGLTKLAITAYANREMTKTVGSIQARYNPETVSLSYVTDYQLDEFINTPQQTNRYQKARPGDLSLELIFDASMPENRNVSVDKQLSLLRALCCEVDAKTGEPYFLQIKWGKLLWNGRGYFAGRLVSLSVRYTLFDRDATPLRAVASLTISADESLVLQKSISDIKSPGSSVVSVPDLSSLALIAAQSSASSLQQNAYLELAFSNNLNSIDALTPGQQLVMTENQE